MTPEEVIADLREECGYDPEGEGSVDDLIAYKDALEDAYGVQLAMCWTYVWNTDDGPSLGGLYVSEEAAMQAAYGEWSAHFGGTLGGYDEGTREEFDRMYSSSGDIWVAETEGVTHV